MTQPKTWEEMRNSIRDMLVKRTGADVAEWNARIAKRKPRSEAELREWLTEQGVTGYPAMLLVMETFGYPDYLTASADQLIQGQYADRPALRPILDALVAVTGSLGGIEVQARKTYVTLVTSRRQFALIRATTRTRVDLGLRLASAGPGGRLLTAKGLGNDTINVRIALESVEDINDDVVDLLRRARDEST